MLQCSLTIERPQIQPYSALSYCWGDINDTVSIHFGGQDFKITRNLEAALRQLRREHEVVVVWADAICINQSDEAERSIQVGLMNQIYSMAEEVIVWLGVECDHSNLAMNLVKFFGQFLHDAGAESLYSYMSDGTVQDSIEEGETEVWTRAEQQGLIILEAWDAVARLLERPWWTRLWIVQEVALARKTRVACGDLEVSWADLLAIPYFTVALDSNTVWNPRSAQLAKSRLGDVTPCTSILIYCENMVDLPSGMLSKFELLSALLQLAPRGCSDARDKVFGCLGMVRSEGMINVDYKQSTAQVYTSCARALAELKEEGVPEVYMQLKIFQLSGVGHLRRATGQLSSLPSWVPDWTAFENGHMPKTLWDHWSNKLRISVQLDFTSSGQAMKVQAFVLDQVKRVEPGTILPWNAKTLSDGPTMCPTGRSSRLHAFFRALMSFDFSGGFRTSEVFSAMAGILYHWFEKRCEFAEEGTRNASLKELYDACDAPPSWNIGTFFPFSLGSLDIQSWDVEFSFVDFLRKFSTDSQRQAAESTSKKSWFSTAEGYLGLGPEGTKEGDLLFVTPGVHVPCLLRGEPRNCVLVGEAYVHGLMEGEISELCRTKSLEQTTLIIH